jgi:sortase A
MARELRLIEPGIRLVRPVLRWSQRLCLVLGLGALGWWTFVTADASWTQASLERSLAVARRNTPLATQLSHTVSQTATETTLVGRIDIGRIGVSAMVVEGDDARALARAVGHIPGTALPGESGNVGLAGHRDTFFRALKNIRLGDDILVTTPRGSYRYSVVSSAVVGPDDTRVLDASRSSSITLVTCYPFHFIGSAPKRFIVHANIVRS